jgi:hypothetical protein
MNTELDEIGYTYLFLNAVVFKDGELLVKLDQASVGVEKEDVEVGEGQAIEGCHPVTVEDESLGYTVRFDDVVLYLAYDECASDWKDDKIESSGVITKFSDSSLIQYAKNKTLVFDITPGEIEHYCVQTADDFIHVLSRGKPIVESKKMPNKRLQIDAATPRD